MCAWLASGQLMNLSTPELFVFIHGGTWEGHELNTFLL